MVDSSVVHGSVAAEEKIENAMDNMEWKNSSVIDMGELRYRIRMSLQSSKAFFRIVTSPVLSLCDRGHIQSK